MVTVRMILNTLIKEFNVKNYLLKMRSDFMKSTSNVRIIDEPISENLKVYDNERKDGFELITRGDTIIIQRCNSRCALCNATRNTKHYSGKLICQDCIDVIKEITGQ